MAAGSSPFSASQFWQEVHRHDARAFLYIGELCRYLLNQLLKPEERNHRVEAVLGNGLRTDIWHDFKRRFGIRWVYEFYGASEGNIPFFNLFNQDRTVGVCPATYELVDYDPLTEQPVLDPEGKPVPVGRGGTGLLIGLHDAFEPGDAGLSMT